MNYTHEQLEMVIKQAGGVSKLAKLTGLHQSSVSAMRKRTRGGQRLSRRISDILESVRKEGIE